MSGIKLNVVRTTKDKIFDVIFLVLTLTIWGIIIWLISRAPDIVPTHFGPSGKPDAYGSPTFILIPSAILTIAALFIAFSIYLPIASVNLPFYKGSGNARQKKLGILLSRIIALQDYCIVCTWIDAFHRHLLIRHEKSRKCNANNNHCRPYNRCITRIHNNDV